MSAPGYWMHETSGRLRPAVEAYLRGDNPLKPEHAAALRAYFRQWIMSPLWDQNPHADDDDRWALAELRRHVNDLTTRETIERWISWVVDEGYDPL